MKSSNGEGSVYKLSGKRRKPWAAAVTTGYTTDGKQVRKLVGTFEKKREAQEALINFTNNPAAFSKKTFKDIRELWWESYLKRNPSEKTVESNRIRMKQLMPLDDFLLKDIKLNDMQNLFDNMRESISWNYRKVCKSQLNMIFEYAVKNDYIAMNKVRHIEIGEKSVVVERQIFTKEEIRTLWNNLEVPGVYCILILIYTGLRIGELLALKNLDIDCTTRTLNIRISKTKSGVRIIPVSNKVFKLISDNIVPGQKYFIGGQKGKLSYPSFFTRFSKILSTLNLREHTIHDTRHTFATLLSNADANPAAVTKLIGHSNYSITETVYTHKDTEELRKAMELIV